MGLVEGTGPILDKASELEPDNPLRAGSGFVLIDRHLKHSPEVVDVPAIGPENLFEEIDRTFGAFAIQSMPGYGQGPAIPGLKIAPHIVDDRGAVEKPLKLSRGQGSGPNKEVRELRSLPGEPGRGVPREGRVQLVQWGSVCGRVPESLAPRSRDVYVRLRS